MRKRSCLPIYTIAYDGKQLNIRLGVLLLFTRTIKNNSFSALGAMMLDKRRRAVYRNTFTHNIIKVSDLDDVYIYIHIYISMYHICFVLSGIFRFFYKIFGLASVIMLACESWESGTEHTMGMLAFHFEYYSGFFELVGKAFFFFAWYSIQ